MAHIWKTAIFDLFSQILVTREKTQKFLQHISHLHIYTYLAHPNDFLFFAFPILQKKKKKCEYILYGFSLVWLMVLILFRAILEQSTDNKMVSKIEVGMSATDIYFH